MNKHILQATILATMVVLSGYSAQVSAGGEQAANQLDILGKADFSPRAYCRAGNGKVTETGTSGVYLCCYEAKTMCVITDTSKSISWLAPYGTQYSSSVTF